MKDPLIAQLKKLKEISPREEYSRLSLRLVLASRAKRRIIPSVFGLPLLRIGGLVALGAIILVIAAQKNEVPLRLAGLDEGSLQAEAKELELTMKLADVTYSPAKDQATTDALKEAANAGAGHLNTSILKKEASGLGTKEYINQNIDSALNEASK
jgi:hypothetical protein